MIYDNITNLIGRTPLIKFNKIAKGLNVEILGKVEFFNPGGSVKDRIALNMVESAEKKGLINKETVLIEPTSGNTGIGLAMVAAAKGYRLILTMPETMSQERRNLLKAYGAEVVLTSGENGMLGSVNKARELAAEIDNSIILQQFENYDNPASHSSSTAIEILGDTEGNIDVFISAVGTGGTLTGNAEVLKKKVPEVEIIAVEPYNSPVLSGGKPGKHKIQGIGAGFSPKILREDYIDKIITVRDEEAFEATRSLVRFEGLLVGISSGAAVFAALQLASKQQYKNKRFVVMLPDSGERYLSTGIFI